MKQIKFKARRVSNNKIVRGNWYTESRPNNAQKVAEGLVGERLKNFMVVVKDIKEGKPIKCQEE